MPDFSALFQSIVPQEALLKLSARRSCAYYDMGEGSRVFFACKAAESTGRAVLYVAGNERLAMQAAEDCNQLLPGRCAVLSGNETVFARITTNGDQTVQRLRVLTNARQNNLKVLCVSADTLMQPMMPPAMFDAACLCVRPGDTMEPGALTDLLVRNGYERTDMVEGRGQCALRGSIVDVFPPIGENALRIEFFDIEIDSIRAFDCISQRSMDPLDSAFLPPAKEYLPPVNDPHSLSGRMRSVIAAQAARLPDDIMSAGLDIPDDPDTQETMPAQSSSVPRALRRGLAGMKDDADALEAGQTFPQIALWAGFIYDKPGFLPDYLQDALILIDTPEKAAGRMQDRYDGFTNELETALTRGEAVPEMAGALFSPEETVRRLNACHASTMQDFLHGMSGIQCEDTCQLTSVPCPRYENRIRDLANDILRWQSEGKRILLLSGSESRTARLKAALEQSGISSAAVISDEQSALTQASLTAANAPCILPLSFSRGFITDKVCLIGDSDIFGTGHRHSHARRNTGERLEAFTDLKEGDYVVHESNGIGIFDGTVRLQTDGTWRDYLVIRYQGTDKLYVPTDQFDRVQKWIGNQDTPPRLNSLSGNDWQKTRSRVKAGLKKLAFDLVKLYAERQNTPGHAFCPDTPWQGQFEDLFPYELTEDQQKAVTAIKQDMESHINMDRLLCGDVGYGKTEVAIRAAFKAVMDGKQVAFLAPTTVLCQQHFHTLTARLRNFPVQVDVLSRFRSPAQQRETLRKLAEGKVDILVGTHRMLSSDVQFKDLGLLIVDEEQRFGVTHKEKIKNIKKTVDVLTLSATPIPRTLHMSMVGVRDMSLLETPPEERFPVQTYVMDYNDGVIRDAIMRELSRGGQVYFLYNRVSSIDQFRARLQALVPEARIAVGHGQMQPGRLEDIMMDFYQGRSDVLLCSTIIENGLDVANANTIIIYDADRFGLSQLYQLRGRVGRSNRAAYAYFTVRADKMLNETAQKRLDAIREFTAFGSGFRIAMRDLEIRGAGNIFGPEQSGNVSDVGYDMYCRLIEEAVLEARRGAGEKVPAPSADTRIDIHIDAFLPQTYVAGAAQRVEIYKRIAAIRTDEDRMDVTDMLIDRFSDPPQSVQNLINISHARALAGKLGINRINHANGSLIMRFDPALMPDMNTLYAAVTETDKRLLFSMGREATLLLRDGRFPPAELLSQLIPILEGLTKKLCT